MVECRPCFRLSDWSKKPCANVAFCGDTPEPDDCACYGCIGLHCKECLCWSKYQIDQEKK